MIFCKPLTIDDDSVEVTEIKNAHNMTTHGSEMKLSCKEKLYDFDFGEGISRIFMTCGKL